MPPRSLAISTTVADRTAEVFRQRILAQAPGFLPGQKLLPLSLATELGISATPVQQAIDRLAADGLVDVVPAAGRTLRNCPPTTSTSRRSEPGSSCWPVASERPTVVRRAGRPGGFPPGLRAGHVRRGRPDVPCRGNGSSANS